MRNLLRGLGGLVGIGVAVACTQLAGDGAGASGTARTPLPPGTGGTCLGDANASCADTTGIASYGACIFTQCSSAYAACFGVDYRAGSYGGACKDWVTCANACGGCDASCLAACRDKSYPAACGACVTQQIEPCISSALSAGSCSAPCPSTDGGAADASGGGCPALAVCCDSLPAERGTDCATAFNAANGLDSACSDTLATYRSAGSCP